MNYVCDVVELVAQNPLESKLIPCGNQQKVIFGFTKITKKVYKTNQKNPKTKH